MAWQGSPSHRKSPLAQMLAASVRVGSADEERTCRHCRPLALPPTRRAYMYARMRARCRPCVLCVRNRGAGRAGARRWRGGGSRPSWARAALRCMLRAGLSWSASGAGDAPGLRPRLSKSVVEPVATAAHACTQGPPCWIAKHPWTSFCLSCTHDGRCTYPGLPASRALGAQASCHRGPCLPAARRSRRSRESLGAPLPCPQAR
jgi:hypothetical protein